MEYPHPVFYAQKLNRVFYMITSQRGDLSLCMLINIYFAHFQCLVRYGIILWSGDIERTDP
jgi:hypothetical protein